MPQEPLSFFGWLLTRCVSDDGPAASREALSTALVFASGMLASAATIYLAGLLHAV